MVITLLGSVPGCKCRRECSRTLLTEEQVDVDLCAAASVASGDSALEPNSCCRVHMDISHHAAELGSRVSIRVVWICRSSQSTLAGWRRATPAARTHTCALGRHRRARRWLRGSRQRPTRLLHIVWTSGVAWNASVSETTCIRAIAVTCWLKDIDATAQLQRMEGMPSHARCAHVYGLQSATHAGHGT